MSPIADPHVCILPSPPDHTSPPRWRCRRCGRTWTLEWFSSEDGARVLGCSWILDV